MNSVRINIKVKKFGLFYEIKSVNMSSGKRSFELLSFTLVGKAK